MRNRHMQGRVLALLLLIAAGTGCFGSGIRALEARELAYFQGLEKETKDATQRLQGLLEDETAFTENAALREAAKFRSNIRHAKLVYSIREVLKAPRGDSQAYIQVTRNKVLLYHLAEAARAEDEALAANLAQGVAERAQLVSDLDALSKLVGSAVASNKLLHAHLNRNGTPQLADFVSEVGRQVSAFNAKLEDADQENPVIQRLALAGETAQKRVERADEGLEKFIDVWSKLNGGK